MSTFRPAIPPIPQVTEDGFHLIVRGGKLLVKATGSGLTLCAAWPRALPRPDQKGTFIGWLKEKPCHAIELPPAGSSARAQQGPPGHTYRELRQLHGLLAEGEFSAAVTAVEVLHYERTYRACPACGGELAAVAETWIRRCAPCELELEPRAQPTVIGLIYDAERILLTQPCGLPRELFTLPATPVGPGQNIEEALKHFLDHTLGVEIGAAVYFGSQAWPYPDRLTIGFHARAAAGELRMDARTFVAARWFHIDDLPALPAPISLARRMADWYAQLPRVSGRPSVPRH